MLVSKIMARDLEGGGAGKAFFDWLLAPGETINAAVYYTTMKILWHAIQNHQQGLLTSGVVGEN
jgi:hypothetical protein